MLVAFRWTANLALNVEVALTATNPKAPQMSTNIVTRIGIWITGCRIFENLISAYSPVACLSGRIG